MGGVGGFSYFQKSSHDTIHGLLGDFRTKVSKKIEPCPRAYDGASLVGKCNRFEMLDECSHPYFAWCFFAMKCLQSSCAYGTLRIKPKMLIQTLLLSLLYLKKKTEGGCRNLICCHGPSRDTKISCSVALGEQARYHYITPHRFLRRAMCTQSSSYFQPEPTAFIRLERAWWSAD